MRAFESHPEFLILVESNSIFCGLFFWICFFFGFVFLRICFSSDFFSGLLFTFFRICELINAAHTLIVSFVADTSMF